MGVQDQAVPEVLDHWLLCLRASLTSSTTLTVGRPSPTQWGEELVLCRLSTTRLLLRSSLLLGRLTISWTLETPLVQTTADTRHLHLPSQTPTGMEGTFWDWRSSPPSTLVGSTRRPRR